MLVAQRRVIVLSIGMSLREGTWVVKGREEVGQSNEYRGGKVVSLNGQSVPILLHFACTTAVDGPCPSNDRKILYPMHMEA